MVCSLCRKIFYLLINKNESKWTKMQPSWTTRGVNHHSCWTYLTGSMKIQSDQRYDSPSKGSVGYRIVRADPLWELTVCQQLSWLLYRAFWQPWIRTIIPTTDNRCKVQRCLVTHPGLLNPGTELKFEHSRLTLKQESTNYSPKAKSGPATCFCK